MGCNPFGKLISLVFSRREARRKKSRKRRPRKARRRDYSTPQPHVVPSHSMAKTVIYRDDSPVEVAQPVGIVQHPPPPALQVSDNSHKSPYNYPRPEAADISLSYHACAAAGVEDTEEATGYAARGEPYYQPEFPEQMTAAAGSGVIYRYMASPVPTSAAWEQPRREEYFGGEYRYCYPTPVREGIYNIATDANRLTTIFSDENPNACSVI